MSESDPEAQRPDDAEDWTVPVAGMAQWDPRETGDTGQHGEPSRPALPGGSLQGGQPGGPVYAGPVYGGPPGYGPPGYGPPGYGPPGYGPPGYGSPGYGPPGYGGGGRGRSARLRQAATLIAVVLIAAGAGAGISYAVAGPSSPSNTASSEPSSPVPLPTAPSFPGGQSPNGSGQQPPAGSGNQGSTTPGSGAPADVSAIAAKVDPALVDINVQFGYQGSGGAGTGIVLTSNGEVLTNNHVIDGATSISVTDIGNGKTYNASVVGYDSINDMAVVQLQGASGLQTASISQSAATVGEPAVAIGNAGGVGGTPSAAGGSVTALNQPISAQDSLDGTTEQLTGMIETNADIQAGDSGGSLVNANGQVIGMDTAASSGFSFQSQSSGTQGFAIPISKVVATARQVESGVGTSDIHVGATAFIGVTVSATGSCDGGGFGGPGQGNPVSGAFICSAVNGGAAQAAGLQQGDVITSLGGQNVDSPSALSKILIGCRPGQSVELGWTDTAGQSHSSSIDLGSGPPA